MTVLAVTRIVDSKEIYAATIRQRRCHAMDSSGTGNHAPAYNSLLILTAYFPFFVLETSSISRRPFPAHEIVSPTSTSRLPFSGFQLTLQTIDDAVIL